MDVSRPSRIAVAGLFLAMLPLLCFAQARRSGYDPAAQAQSPRQKDGFVDFALQKVFDFPPTALPLETEQMSSLGESELKSDLGALGYPGFSYLRGKPTRNPAQLLFFALDQPDLDTRVVEALPWLTCTYVEMNWDWLVSNAKLHDRQNRLGFVVTLAGELAQKTGDSACSRKLTDSRALLERSRLVREDTLCHNSMTKAERKWLRLNRPPEARHWNLLTDLDVRHLAYARA